MPLAAALSDRIGRKPLLLIGAIMILFSAYPVFWLLLKKKFIYALFSQIIFAVVVSIFMGPVPTTLVELFPTRVRFTGVAVSYNISAAIFGGTAPMVAFWLIRVTGNNYAMAYYIGFFCIFTICALRYYKETYLINLSD